MIRPKNTQKQKETLVPLPQTPQQLLLNNLTHIPRRMPEFEPNTASKKVGNKTPSSINQFPSNCSHEEEENKEASGIPTSNTTTNERPREGGGANTRVGVNTKTRHTFSMNHTKMWSILIAN